MDSLAKQDGGAGRPPAQEVRRVVVGIVHTNCYVITDRATGFHAVIDPGDNATRIITMLGPEKAKYVKYIFLTHGHFDHVTALKRVRDATRAPAVIHKEDVHMLSDPKIGRSGKDNYSKADIRIVGGESFDMGETTFTWLHTPGHTRGSCCIMCHDKIFTGDTLFEGDCGRTDFAGGSRESMLESLRLLANLPGDYTIFPGHDVSTTLEKERRSNPDMLEAIARGAN
ncbi:MAG: MBL fold metallo-hydrolase [Oscillospiraceae bacterium]|jgi:glyoxylase-like metal-dependent hydrolase (beta-lactamase superfamily II)|nr:MBL fold metallo-hydrolase [Oscillospiraceae bacterium]